MAKIFKRKYKKMSVQTSSACGFKYSKPIHKVLWYNLPAWLPIGRITEHAETCQFNNGEHTVNKSLSNSSSAIVFCMSDGAVLKRPPRNAHERPANQVWIYYGLEPPTTQERMYKGSIPSWVNSFNWSMTYHLDSDIVFPYGVLKTKQFVESKRKAMNRNWSNQKANPALKTEAGNK